MPRTIDRVYMRLHRVFMPPGRKQNAIDRAVVRWWTRFDVAMYRLLGFSASAKMMGVRVLMLETTGRRTGRTRRALVAYVERGDHLVVGGGNWGWDRDPGWFYNATANPHVVVTRGRRSQPMRARALTGVDDDEAGELLGTAYPHSMQYVARRTRPVPRLALEPI